MKRGLKVKIFRSGLLSSINQLDHGFIYNFRDKDVPSNTLKNFSNIKTLKQVHSSKVLFFDKHNLEKDEIEGDAMFTNIKNLCLGIYTADCVPIILYDPYSGVVCAIHAGWRGTRSEITKKAVKRIKEEFPSSGEDILAVTGPSIGRCCYEVDYDVASQFLDISEDYTPFINERINGKFMLDLQGINILQLKDSGVSKIESANICTMCNTDFPSFRRDGSYTGRIFTYIGLV